MKDIVTATGKRVLQINVFDKESIKEMDGFFVLDDLTKEEFVSELRDFFLEIPFDKFFYEVSDNTLSEPIARAIVLARKTDKK